MSDEYVEVRKLSPKIRLLWFSEYLTMGIVAWLILSFLTTVLPFPYLDSYDTVTRTVMLLGLIIVVLIPIFIWVELRYRHFSYLILDHELVIREGVISQKSINIPYSSIENLSVDRSLIDRIFKIGSVVIDTAGGDAKEGLLPGVENPAGIIELINLKLKDVQGSGEKERDELEYKVLQEIRDELTEIKSLLGGKTKTKKTTKKRKKTKKSKKSSGDPFMDEFKNDS